MTTMPLTTEALLAMTPTERAGLSRYEYPSRSSCTNCSGCVECSDCTTCRCCVDCADCVDCHGCDDCTFCIGIAGGRELRYVAWGVQLTREQWEEINLEGQS